MGSLSLPDLSGWGRAGRALGREGKQRLRAAGQAAFPVAGSLKHSASQSKRQSVAPIRGRAFGWLVRAGKCGIRLTGRLAPNPGPGRYELGRDNPQLGHAAVRSSLWPAPLVLRRGVSTW